MKSGTSISHGSKSELRIAELGLRISSNGGIQKIRNPKSTIRNPVESAEIREFTAREDLATLSESLIVNCTGLGARELFNDDELIALKGQLTMLVPQREVSYGTFGGVPGRASGGFYHMIPRSDGLAMGGTSQRGDWSLEPDEDARRRIVDTHLELFNGMRAPDPEARLSAAAPSEIPALESFFGLES